MPNELRTIAEAAEQLRVSVSTLRLYRRNGTGPASFLLGGKVMYRAAELDRWVNEQAGDDRGAQS